MSECDSHYFDTFIILFVGVGGSQGVEMLEKDRFIPEVAKQKWDRVRIEATQPWNTLDK